MKELWDIAIQPHNLPLTCVVGVFMLYWSICILGIFGIDTFDIDLDAEGVVSSPVAATLRFVNATEVPLMAVLTILSVFMWVSSMMGNYYFNPELSDVLILSIFAGSFVVGVILTKMATAPLVPAFRKMKELEKAEPAVGGVGVVISKQVDQKYGQVELKRKEGAPATLNCRTSDKTPIPRGAEAIIISYDNDTGTYLVRKL
ncbi:MAG: hypothetical protein ABF379_17025 [Akkermansiaceae bacterium]